MTILQMKTSVFILVLIKKMWMWACQRAERISGAHNEWKRRLCVCRAVKVRNVSRTRMWKRLLNVMKRLCFSSKARAKGLCQRPDFMNRDVAATHHRVEGVYVVIGPFSIKNRWRNVFAAVVHVPFSECCSFIRCWCHSSPAMHQDMSWS